MLQVANTTPFKTGLFLAADRQGVETAFLVVKATFDLLPQVLVSAVQCDITLADEWWGEAGCSSLRYGSDMHLAKQASDIIVNAKAHAPEGRPVTEMSVGIAIGQLRKRLQISGDRVWRNGKPGEPQPFEQIPIQYEVAAGGTHRQDNGEVAVDRRNPVGRGYVGAAGEASWEGLSLPNVEDYQRRLVSLKELPDPAGFGFIAPHWLPRCSYAGSYDEQWQKHRAPFLPADFDDRYWQQAHPDLIYPGFLQGGEPVQLIGLHPGRR